MMPDEVEAKGDFANPATAHLPALDGVRGLAIALVLVVHCYNRGPDPKFSGSALDRLVDQLLRFGWSGVELFFVLSGLLVTSILLRRKRQNKPLGPFYARRLARIVPAYIAITTGVAALGFLSINSLVDPVTQEARSLWPYYALFFNNYFGFLGIASSDADKALGPLWSVATEMQYYLIWPLLVNYLSERKLKLLLPCLLAANIGFRFLMVNASAPPGDIYVASLTHLDGILVGSMLALHWKNLGGFARIYAGRALALAGLLLVGLFIWAGTTDALSPVVQRFGYTLIAGFYASFLLIAVAGGRVSRMLSFAPLCQLGKYSYFIYLIHWPVLLVLDHLVPDRGIFAYLAYLFLVTMGLMALGAASWKFFENPIIAWNLSREARTGFR